MHFFFQLIITEQVTQLYHPMDQRSNLLDNWWKHRAARIAFSSGQMLWKAAASRCNALQSKIIIKKELNINIQTKSIITHTGAPKDGYPRLIHYINLLTTYLLKNFSGQKCQIRYWRSFLPYITDVRADVNDRSFWWAHRSCRGRIYVLNLIKLILRAGMMLGTSMYEEKQNQVLLSRGAVKPWLPQHCFYNYSICILFFIIVSCQSHPSLIRFVRCVLANHYNL